MKWYLILLVCFHTVCEKSPDVGWQMIDLPYPQLSTEKVCRRRLVEHTLYINSLGLTPEPWMKVECRLMKALKK